MDWKFEAVVVPVSDMDRAKQFYEQAGFHLDVDHRAGDFRVIQVTPVGSACSVILMRNLGAPGSLQGLHLVVRDIDAARSGAGRARHRGERRLPLRGWRPGAGTRPGPRRLRLLPVVQRPGRQRLDGPGGAHPPELIGARPEKPHVHARGAATAAEQSWNGRHTQLNTDAEPGHRGWSHTTSVGRQGLEP